MATADSQGLTDTAGSLMRDGIKRLPNEDVEQSTLRRRVPTQQYVVQKVDGSPPDPNARYLVLRLDSDPAARIAGRAFADAVATRDPALAEAVRSQCRATAKRGWSLPEAPQCHCGSDCIPIALRDVGRWSLEWECPECCDPVNGPAITWPFADVLADGEDFERLGFQWDVN